MTHYLTTDHVLEIHRWGIQAYGGDGSVINPAMLESATAQPQATFDGKDLLPTVYDKAAALCYSLNKNHAFSDGNKRAGFYSMATFLMLNGYAIDCDADEGERMMTGVADGTVNREQLTQWVASVAAQPGATTVTATPPVS